MGLFGWTFIVFLILKLTGFITWSWVWVTAPLWGGLVLWLSVVVIFSIIAAATETATARRRR